MADRDGGCLFPYRRIQARKSYSQGGGKMRMSLTVILLLCLVVGCATTRQGGERATEAMVNAALFEDPQDGKRLVIKFVPEVPAYDVVYRRDNRTSEVRWKA